MGAPKGQTNNPFGRPIKNQFSVHKSVNVRFDFALYEKLKRLARDKKQTLPDFIRTTIQYYEAITHQPTPETEDPTRDDGFTTDEPTPPTQAPQSISGVGPALKPKPLKKLRPHPRKRAAIPPPLQPTDTDPGVPYDARDPLRALGANVIEAIEVPELSDE